VEHQGPLDGVEPVYWSLIARAIGWISQRSCTLRLRQILCESTTSLTASFPYWPILREGHLHDK
jgi:hypothetical protein